uniref:Uncharacterized protein n=1 Tax=Candidatus Kentrum eta TaxID=2126337 RepID=A0A450UWA7_9GAMM|nr:MAG: hypothetical protein BECKH772A_GA0070896_100978 [Candidatus Kentron sp. H]VFJ96807.1 MAG: hypothetical protein BECKH772B_GA0070898_100988 [Candidatus Kentron sp. H]VFK02552.1 MAG: hypothetical protein BECKH772C_GA0070978_100943 [Candidatus Kentron sp. H]
MDASLYFEAAAGVAAIGGGLTAFLFFFVLNGYGNDFATRNPVPRLAEREVVPL